MPALNGPSQQLEHSDLLGRGRSAGTQYGRGLFQAARPPDVQQTASARHAFVSAANKIGTTQSVKTARLRCGIVPFTRLPSHGEGHMLGIIARREFITLLGGAAAWPLAARAQQGERVRRIGVLMGGPESDPEEQARLAAFLDGLQQLGWTDGRTVRIDTRWPAGDADRFRTYAAELVGLAPDVILASA